MILVGDALARLTAMPSDSVHCVVTSPPYWGLRDYGVPPQIWGGDADCRHRWGTALTAERRPYGADIVGHGSMGPRKREGGIVSQGAFCARCNAWRGVLGLEPDYRLYVGHLVAVLREVRRVLRPDGNLWLNLGDCYATGAGKAKRAGGGAQGAAWQGGAATQPNRMPQSGLKPKDLVGIPWRVAFALQDDGWWLRRDVVWAKRNPMPESVRDRPTTAHEYLFLLTKSARYFYDAEAIKEPAEYGYSPTKGKMFASVGNARSQPRQSGSTTTPGNGGTRNKRSVWSIATAPFAEAHFATFPPLLVEPCILAGTSAHGVCPHCAAPWQRIVKQTRPEYRKVPGTHGTMHTDGNGRRYPDRYDTETATIGWRATCKCGPNYADPIPATVLDPFLGAGTTGLVAARLGRDWIGIELSPAYAEIARRRLGLAPQLKKAA